MIHIQELLTQINETPAALKALEIILLLAASFISDIRTYKIKNVIIILFASAGIITNTIFCGTGGLIYSVTGILTPVAALFILYAARMIGAGDVKLFGVIGSIMGWKFSLFCTAYTFMLGGCIGLVLLAVNRNAAERFKYFICYLKSCFLSLSILEYSSFGEKKGKFRLTYAVIPGVLLQLAVILSNRGVA